MLRSLWRLWKGCQNDHVWFPDATPREFIPVVVVCLRCTATKRLPPWGQCLGGQHPLADHYDDEGRIMRIDNCWAPQ